ncbi:ribonuclease H-like [Protopterus annectens]|uniref:ribonuclease H-like n=1 Tax=Protopterus annectens TaxID=7888 RepID=UPI001CFB36A5|nr:ribonuclease H-like [Protopterus annectens]
MEKQKPAWFTDGSAKIGSSGRTWTAVAYCPQTETVLFNKGTAGSSNQAELRAVALVIDSLPHGDKAYIYTDSWAVYKGLTTWLPAWQQQDWKIHGRPLWGGSEDWQQIGKKAQQCQIRVGHVDAHASLVTGKKA